MASYSMGSYRLSVAVTNLVAERFEKNFYNQILSSVNNWPILPITVLFVCFFLCSLLDCYYGVSVPILIFLC